MFDAISIAAALIVMVIIVIKANTSIPDNGQEKNPTSKNRSKKNPSSNCGWLDDKNAQKAYLRSLSATDPFTYPDNATSRDYEDYLKRIG